MKKQALYLVSFFSIILFTLFSCKKDDSSTSTTSTDNQLDKAGYELDSCTNTGKNGCFELVYPISVTVDNTIVTIDSQEDFRTKLHAFASSAQSSGKKHPRINFTINFPISVITDSGAVVTINSIDELKALKKSCNQGYFNQGFDKGKHHGYCKDRKSCYKLNFPVTIIYPNASEVAYNNAKDLKTALKTWKSANPNATTHPEFKYPLSVTLKDGTVSSIADKAALKALKSSCK